MAIRKTDASQRKATVVSVEKNPVRGLHSVLSQRPIFEDNAFDAVEGFISRSPAVALAYTQALVEKLAIPSDRLQQRKRVTESSALAFFGAYPSLFQFDDVSNPMPLLPRPAPQMTIVGDAHLFNFGTIRCRDGETVWGINDYDQALPGKPESDLKRLATSVVLTARDAGMKAREEPALVKKAAKAYFDEIGRLRSGKAIPPYLAEKSASGVVQSLIHGAAAMKRKTLLADLTVEAKGQLHFKTNKELKPVSAARQQEVVAALQTYGRSLPDDARVKKPLVVLAVAERLGKGGSSNGLDRYAVLVEHAKEGKLPIVLEVKHAPPSPTGAGVSELRPSDAAAVLVAQERLGGLENPLTGSLKLGPKSMLVREVEPEKAKLKAVDLKAPIDLEETVVQAALVLARAHARHGNAAVLARWVGDDGETAGLRLAQFAVDKANQVERDFAAVTA